MNILTANEWDNFLSQYPDAHLMQTSQWGDFKSYFGWEVVRVTTDEVPGTYLGAQILLKRLPLGYRIAYIPKGPPVKRDENINLSVWEPLWHSIDKICKQRNVIFLKVEADLLERPSVVGRDEPVTQPITKFLSENLENNENHHVAFGKTIPIGFIEGDHNIQPRRTILVSLNGDEERILSRMKQKTRYNIRLALKKGVVVKRLTDLNLFYNLAEVTSTRDDFPIHSRAYYQKAYEIFHPRGMCEMFLADYQGEPLAALVVFAKGKRAWYFYGASSNMHRERMPTYLLQWEAMRWAKSIGCTEYDLWGVPDEDESELEKNFTSRTDNLWGVYRFKRGFGGKVYRAVPSWDRIYKPFLYNIYKFLYSRRKTG